MYTVYVAWDGKQEWYYVQDEDWNLLGSPYGAYMFAQQECDILNK